MLPTVSVDTDGLHAVGAVEEAVPGGQRLAGVAALELGLAEVGEHDRAGAFAVEPVYVEGEVAQHASTEAGLIARQAELCPVLATTPLLDTIRLAQRVIRQGVTSYGLDALMRHYDIPQPAGRHRAMPDVEVTASKNRQVPGFLMVGWRRRIRGRPSKIVGLEGSHHSPASKAVAVGSRLGGLVNMPPWGPHAHAG